MRHALTWRYWDETLCIDISSIIVASLSEPHTSVTALRICVYMFACLLGPITYHKFEMSAFIYFKHVKANGSLTVRVQRW